MSDLLSEEEDLARLKSWWSEYGTTILVSVGIAAVVIIGWRWWQSNEAANVAAASDAYQIYLQAADAERGVALGTLAQEHGTSAYYAFALLDQAKRATVAGDLEAAQQHLQLAVDAAPHDLLADLARLRLASVLHGLDQSTAALSMLSSIKTDGYRAWALETKGDIHAAAGDVSEAHAAYQAAKDSLQGDVERPILELKLNNAAPFGEQFVEYESSLDAALSAAQNSLEQAEGGEDALAESSPVETDSTENEMADEAAVDEPPTED